eukprot:TRINITY_DN4709_c0_g1_i1.p1 TRINITY_DN4709_c0_g1~~TRINITY_DN4709_c0_g1_i1.p1  ORF type:complete len:91 (+),score=3.49 TRINITY_DN4709_c0_g1_i1:88-360(+)
MFLRKNDMIVNNNDTSSMVVEQNDYYTFTGYMDRYQPLVVAGIIIVMAAVVEMRMAVGEVVAVVTLVGITRVIQTSTSTRITNLSNSAMR